MTDKTDIPHARLIPFTISFALFMEAVDTTIINTAIPAMSSSLNVNPIDLKIALISYLLTLAIFIPISGWIAEKFGIKRVFIIGLAIFIFASFWCGYANSLVELVIARAIQGVGGSVMSPVGRLMIVRTFKRHELITIMGRVVVVAALGMMLGPVLGGYITHYFSWRWIFWVNIPIGMIAILMAYRWLADVKPMLVPKLDIIGFMLFGVSLSGLTFGLSALSESTLNPLVAIMILSTAVFLMIVYFWRSRKQKNPVVNLQLFVFRTFRVSAMANIVVRISFGGVPFLLPLLLQIGLNYPAQISGLLLAPTAFGVLLIKPFSAKVFKFFGFKRFLILNTLIVSLVIGSFILIDSYTSIYVIALLTFIFGFLMALQYTGMNSLAYAEVPQANLSAVTSIMSTIQQMAQSFGVAVSALLIHYFSLFYGQTVHLTPIIFHHAFLALGIITLLSIIVFVRLEPRDGEQLIQQQME